MLLEHCRGFYTSVDMAVKVRGTQGFLLSKWLCSYCSKVVFVLRLADIIFSAQRGALMLLRVIAMLKAEDFRNHPQRCFLTNTDLS